MPDPMREQLGAYLDGELPALSLPALQVHLDTCPACREELAALRRLSETLRQAPLPASLPPAWRFTDQLMQRLPPRPDQRIAGPAPRAGWLVPLGLLTALVLIQATTILSALAALVGRTGLLGDLGAWFTNGTGQTLWFGAAQVIFRNVMSLKVVANLQTANDVVLGLQQWLISPLLWQLGVALVYLACLAVWWSRRQPSQSDEQVME